VPKLKIKQVFAVCREKSGSINGTLIGCLIDEGMRKEHAMLAQAESEGKVPFANRKGKPDTSYGSVTQVAKLKRELTLAQRQIANLKNQLQQAKENIVKERAERCSKSKKDDSQFPTRMKLGVRESVNKLSKPRRRNRKLHQHVRYRKDSRCFRQVVMTRRKKRIVQSRMLE
jgi:hypothetical protein